MFGVHKNPSLCRNFISLLHYKLSLSSQNTIPLHIYDHKIKKYTDLTDLNDKNRPRQSNRPRLA